LIDLREGLEQQAAGFAADSRAGVAHGQVQHRRGCLLLLAQADDHLARSVNLIALLVRLIRIWTHRAAVRADTTSARGRSTTSSSFSPRRVTQRGCNVVDNAPPGFFRVPVRPPIDLGKVEQVIDQRQQNALPLDCTVRSCVLLSVSGPAM